MSNSTTDLSASVPFKFGSYEWACSQAALTVCPRLGAGGQGIEPVCYARNVDVGSSLFFQPATTIAHVAALIMVFIMVLHIRSKYTAVGRKEILIFFYMYAGCELLGIFLDSGIIPASSEVYDWFAAILFGLVTATYWCLLVNGFVGFQFAEDGTALSLWSLRISSLVVFLISGFIAIGTFLSLATLTPENAMGLWIIQFVFPLVCVAIYVVLQFVLVLRTLDDRWPIGDLIFGIGAYVVGLVILFGFSNDICDAVKHYIDGTFFGTVCTLLAVMMIYKYWDSITTEDLEFSVGSKTSAWEVKESLLRADEDEIAGGATVYPSAPGAGYPPVPGKSPYERPTPYERY